MKHTLPDQEPFTSPTTCPFCQSPSITTASDKVDSSSYWRCQACGQVWNAERLKSSFSNRPSYGGRSNNGY
jgi:transposase-like protein